MRKVFKLENLDCAVCAQKMEDGVKKLSGVENASVSFMSARMTVDFADGVDVGEMVGQISKVCKKVEPDCVVVM